MPRPGNSSALQFIVVGAQRAGSTSLSDELALNPAVYIPSLELPVFEPKYFSAGAVRVLERYYPRKQCVRGLKRPDYLGSPTAATNIAATYPDCSILAVLRDPMERFLSAAYWYQYVGLIPVMSLDKVMEEVRPLGAHPVSQAEAGNPFAQLLANGLYGRHLRHCYSCFPESSIHVYFYDELKTPTARRRAATQFLREIDVSMGEWRPGGETRQNPGIYNRQRLRFLSSRPKTFSWETTAKFEYIPHRLLRTPMRSFVSAGFHAVDRRLLRKIFRDNRPEQLRTGDRNWLRDVYAADLERQTCFVLPRQWALRYGINGARQEHV